jgi:hypothetical protein
LNKRIGITCLIILGSACLLSAIILVGGVGVFMWDKAHPIPTITAAPTLAIPPTNTTCPNDICQDGTSPDSTTPTESTTPVAIPTAELPKYISKIMDQIQIEVIQIRGLFPNGEIPRALLSPAELRNKVINDFLVEYTPEDAQNDTIVLSELGLIPKDFNLLSFYEDLYSEQIAGFYDDETKEMYVVRSGGFGGLEKMTYSHEFTHVLQDQNYDLRNGLNVNDEDCNNDSERCAAVMALIEGDASLTEFTWLYEYASDEDRSDIQTFYQSYQSPVYDSAPAFMKEDFMFPYVAGQEFVQVLFDLGGWQAVNNAYANPPVSTEQIMHPSRYPTDKPIPVGLPNVSSVLGEGWSRTVENVIGEWYTYLILTKGYQYEMQIDDTLARKAVEGWGGDLYQIYYNPDSNQAVAVISFIWDTNKDSREFFDAFNIYGTARWGSPTSQNNTIINWHALDQYTLIKYDSPRTIIIIAPDPISLDLISQTLDVN